jgi:hypothetical protein
MLPLDVYSTINYHAIQIATTISLLIFLYRYLGEDIRRK